jgi:hypothetical protein
LIFLRNEASLFKFVFSIESDITMRAIKRI